MVIPWRAAAARVFFCMRLLLVYSSDADKEIQMYPMRRSKG